MENHFTTYGDTMLIVTIFITHVRKCVMRATPICRHKYTVGFVLFTLGLSLSYFHASEGRSGSVIECLRSRCPGGTVLSVPLGNTLYTYSTVPTQENC